MVMVHGEMFLRFKRKQQSIRNMLMHLIRYKYIRVFLSKAFLVILPILCEILVSACNYCSKKQNAQITKTKRLKQ